MSYWTRTVVIHIGLNDGGKVYLYDLLIRHSRQENVLLVVVGMEPNNVRNLPVAKPVEALAGLSIPQFHLPVISTRQELAAIVRERNVLDSFYVSMECPHTVPMSVYVPQLKKSVRSSRKQFSALTYLDLGVHRAAEEEVSGIW